MAKTKSKVSNQAADGAGGMAPLQDRRFEQDDWPIRFDVPEQEADNWLQYLSAECQKREWNISGNTHIEAKENSGTVTVYNGVTGQQLAVVWERKRGGPIKVRARSINAFPFPLDQANELFRDVKEH